VLGAPLPIQAPDPLAERVRVEHYALVTPPREVVGLARVLRRVREHDVQYELELESWTHGARVRLVETHGTDDAGAPRHELVWREHFGALERPGGRCVIARWHAAGPQRPLGELESLQWGALEPVRRQCDLESRPLFPLEASELERGGYAAVGPRYEPLSDRVENLIQRTFAESGIRSIQESFDGEPCAPRRVYGAGFLLAFRPGPASAWAIAIPESRWRELGAARATALAAAVTRPLPAQVSPDGYPAALVGASTTR
jgi:hypothetical protein